jgi:hypothetical protein
MAVISSTTRRAGIFSFFCRIKVMAMHHSFILDGTLMGDGLMAMYNTNHSLAKTGKTQAVKVEACGWYSRSITKAT